MKKLMLAALVFMLAWVIAPVALQANEISVTIDGVTVDFDGQPPIIVDGRTLVPVRGVFEALGFEVEWQQETQTATLMSDEYIVIISIGNDIFTTNGEEMPLDVPAQIIEDRTLLPIRAVLESVGHYVGWNNATRTVIVETETSFISVRIPRELFFTGGSEEAFLEFFEEFGGIVAELNEDVTEFWRNHRENPGTVYIEVTFPLHGLAELIMLLEDDVHMFLEMIMEDFDSISAYEVEKNDEVTRFIFTADIDELAGGMGIIWLLDVVFPYLGQLEYLIRIFSLYEMDALQDILFCVEDAATGELIEIYSFLADAPIGLYMRHIAQ